MIGGEKTIRFFFKIWSFFSVATIFSKYDSEVEGVEINISLHSFGPFKMSSSRASMGIYASGVGMEGRLFMVFGGFDFCLNFSGSLSPVFQHPKFQLRTTKFYAFPSFKVRNSTL